MKPWLLRGLGLALVHVVVRVLLGAALVQWPLQGSVLRWLGLIVVVVAAFLWAGLDGIRDRRAHPDPEEGADLTLRWLAAGAVTGIVGGVLTWLVDTVTAIPVGVTSLFFEVTSGAAFTVLLVFLPATAAVTLGRFFARRQERRAERNDDWSEHSEHHVSTPATADPAWRDADAPTTTFPTVNPKQ
ncbi:B-4DMT family transporter [Rhodococcus sp. Z13]|uniref:B-4DMT family transporter n=1 Tax=Rhodococcus sacchari TaxID=2962047 RepID=A0ACD4DL42_9NOCA|nr:B-4DMT family transporter [Rhodococcus sp. Z13]UYP20737.1 B-4DMT family transporter [Rhodococcus sp. Z13]